MITDYAMLCRLFVTSYNRSSSLITVLKNCVDNTTSILAERLKKDVKNYMEGTCQSLCKLYQDTKDEDKDYLLQSWASTLPYDLYNLVLQALHRPENTNNNKDYLMSYIMHNIALIPSKNKKPLVAYSQKPDSLITTASILDTWMSKGVTEFGFIPSKHGLIVIDLDNTDGHANHTDGITNFKMLIHKANLSDRMRAFLTDLSTYPCYTVTPHNGLHLYFRDTYLTDELKQQIDTSRLNGLNIEIKYNTKVTAAGSIINNRSYVMHGNIDNIPNMTLDLLDSLLKDKPKKTVYTTDTATVRGGSGWNTTPEGIINKAIELYSNESPHYFVQKTAVLFRNAGFNKDIAESYILQTDKHTQRHDQADTLTAIQSIYGRERA